MNNNQVLRLTLKLDFPLSYWILHDFTATKNSVRDLATVGDHSAAAISYIATLIMPSIHLCEILHYILVLSY